MSDKVQEIRERLNKKYDYPMLGMFAIGQMQADIRTLLAEVDRLRINNIRYVEYVNMQDENSRLTTALEWCEAIAKTEVDEDRGTEAIEDIRKRAREALKGGSDGKKS